VGLNPTGAPFDPSAFTLFDAWVSHRASDEGSADAGRAVARGQDLFNTRAITLSGVAGLNNETFSNGVTLPASFTGTCTTCHDTPNAGNHSVKAPLNIGLTDESRRTPDLPLYTLRRISDGTMVRTTDPGRAMKTGKWADIGKFKTDPPRTSRPRALFPQRARGHPDGCGGVLRHPLPDRTNRPGESRPRGVPAVAVTIESIDLAQRRGEWV
jgi:hypothetical protein